METLRKRLRDTAAVAGRRVKGVAAKAAQRFVTQAGERKRAWHTAKRSVVYNVFARRGEESAAAVMAARRRRKRRAASVPHVSATAAHVARKCNAPAKERRGGSNTAEGMQSVKWGREEDSCSHNASRRPATV